MPEDHRAEIMDALLDGRTQFRNGRHNENPVLYGMHPTSTFDLFELGFLFLF